MMKKILTSHKKYLLVISVLWGLFLPAALLVPAVHTYAQAKDQVCLGLNGCPDSEGTVKTIVGAALNIVSIVIGIAGVLMIMIGGFRYITAGGDASKTASAQGTIIWALVGLVVAALSQVIVRFVLDAI